MEILTRSFIAIELNEEILRNLAGFIRMHGLSQALGLRPVKPEIIHLTLKFLGEASTIQLNKVDEQLTSITSHIPSFEISVEGFGAFPNWRMPRTVWAGVKYPLLLQTLNDEIEKAAVNIGFLPERRAFSPHLTLARVNNADLAPDVVRALTKAADTEPAFGKMTVQQVVLFKSVLQHNGPIYTALSAYSLSDSRRYDRI